MPYVIDLRHGLAWLCYYVGEARRRYGSSSAASWRRGCAAAAEHLPATITREPRL